MPPTLTLQQKNKLSMASSSAIANIFQSLYSNFSYGEWLHTNAYLVNTTKTIEDHFKNSCIIDLDLCNYIAASIPTHCMDGWSFLGRALHCIMRGDPNTARHLAYYAELRAAMSLLASGGIGVFNNSHVVIDQNQHAQELQGVSTHPFTWLALENWAATPQAANIIGEIIKIDHYPLKDWLTEYSASGILSSLASYWLSTCGLDLNILITDRDARNIVSYRPSHITQLANVTALDSGRFISNFWSTLNPFHATRFNQLDRYLIRKSLKKINLDIPLVDVNGVQLSYDDRISRMLNKFSFTNLMKNSWQDFFVNNNYPDPFILTEAEKRRSFTDPQHHLEVISRATLLLRIATGVCFQLINNSSYSSSDLQFWWNNLGIEKGLWNERNKPGTNSGDIVSLWDEVDNAINKMDAWMSRVSRPSYSGLIKTQNTSLRILEGCERIGLWGLIP